MKLFNKKWKKIVAGSFILLLFILLVSIQVYPIKNEPIKSPKLNSSLELNADSLLIGWSSATLNPTMPLYFAGYGISRKPNSTYLDSLRVSCIVFKASTKMIVWLNYDLLFVHPFFATKVKLAIQNKYGNEVGVYFSATHTHHGFGGWANGFLAPLMAGEWQNENVINTIVHKTMIAMDSSIHHLASSSIYWGRTSNEKRVKNRLDHENSKKDVVVRCLKIVQAKDSLCLVSYSAHPICLSHLRLQFSRDYPGVLVEKLKEQGYQDAIYVAGMVGSHVPVNDYDDDVKNMHQLAGELSDSISKISWKRNQFQKIKFQKLDFEIPTASLQFSYSSFGLRSWLVKKLAPSKNFSVSALHLADFVILGFPCDYSGEFASSLDSVSNKKILVSSFNGNYWGYVTPNCVDTVEHAETREMRWIGNNGNRINNYIIDYLKKNSTY